MSHNKMSIVELYVELMRRSCQQERFSHYARVGTLMERYRESRDESLVNEFKSIFRKELIVRGLLECNKVCDENVINHNYGCRNKPNNRLEHFKDCIVSYQGKDSVGMSDCDIREIRDYITTNYDEEITRSDLIKICKALGKKIGGRENALLALFNPSELDDISHLEDVLIDDFIEFSNAYDEIMKDGRRIVFVKFVLMQLLRRRGHSPMSDYVGYTNARKKHNDICRMVFERLGWDFEEI